MFTSSDKLISLESFTFTPTTNSSINANALHKWIHNGTDNTYSMNTITVTWTDDKTHSKIRKLNVTNNKVEGLKVKAL